MLLGDFVMVAWSFGVSTRGFCDGGLGLRRFGSGLLHWCLGASALRLGASCPGGSGASGVTVRGFQQLDGLGLWLLLLVAFVDDVLGAYVMPTWGLRVLLAAGGFQQWLCEGRTSVVAARGYRQ